MAEDMGDEAQELASRLGKAKELIGELNRTSTLLDLSLRELTISSTLTQEVKMKSQPLSRREFIKLIGYAGGAVALTACGGAPATTAAPTAAANVC